MQLGGGPKHAANPQSMPCHLLSLRVAMPRTGWAVTPLLTGHKAAQQPNVSEGVHPYGVTTSLRTHALFPLNRPHLMGRRRTAANMLFLGRDHKYTPYPLAAAPGKRRHTRGHRSPIRTHLTEGDGRRNPVPHPHTGVEDGLTVLEDFPS